MRKIPAASIFVLICCLLAFGQTQNNVSNCPTISVIVPKSLVRPGESIKFKADISSIDLTKIEYKWSISNGIMEEGQGTPEISVDTSGLFDKEIIATVIIQGLPAGCENSARESGIVANGGHPMVVDEFEKLSARDEKGRLFQIVLELRKDSANSALIILYHTRKDNKKTLGKRVERIKNFLINENKISEERVNIVFGGLAEFERTRIYIVPEGASMPEDFDTKKSLDKLDFSPTKNN